MKYSEKELLHIQLMRAVLNQISDKPVILKGGTALMLEYGLDRFSEDLDLDSSLKFNIERKIKQAFTENTNDFELRIVKNTDTVQRFKSRYQKEGIENRLKIEISFRSSVNKNDYHRSFQGNDSFLVYNINKLIEQKLKAFENRTAPRDLYDIHFIAQTHLKEFSNASQLKFVELTKNINTLEERYRTAFEEDDVLDADKLEGILISLDNINENISNSR